MQGKVMTVLGPVEPDTLGITLTHEHLLIDLRVWCEEPEDEEQKAFVHAPVEMETLGAIRREPFGNLDNCVLDDTALAIEELRRFKTAGGGSVVDCTNNGLGRTPAGLGGNCPGDRDQYRYGFRLLYRSFPSLRYGRSVG